MPVVRQWMDANLQRDNWYLHVNLWDPHTPYRVPLDYGEPFKDSPLPAWLTDEVLERHRQKTGPHSALDFGGMYDDRTDPAYPRHPGGITDRVQLRRVIDGYDTAIRYVDDQVAWIVQQLKAAGIYEETAIILSADHAENLGELGIYGEHATADDATCHIPLIIKWPGGKAGHVDEGLHYNLDWAPTLMDLLGRPKHEIWDGQSFAPAICDGVEAGREELVIGQCCHVCERSVRWDRWLYIRTYHDGFHLFPQEMLFDLEADLHEQNDLAPDRPDLCREGAWRLERWHDQQMQKMSRFSSNICDPLWTVIADGGPEHARHRHPGSPLPEYLKRLETTGRAAGARALREKYGAYLPGKSA